MIDPDNEQRIENQILNLLNKAGALPESPDMTDAELEAAERHGRQALEGIVSRPRPHRRSRRRTLAVRSAATLLVAAAAGVVLVVTRPNTDHQPSATGAPTPPMLTFSLVSKEKPLDGTTPTEALNTLAVSAARSQPNGTGGYQLIEAESWQLTASGTNGVFVPAITKRYVEPDGTAIVVRWTGQPLNRDGLLLAPMSPTAPGVHATQSSEPATKPDPATLNPNSNTLLADLGGPAGCGGNASCVVSSIAALHARTVVGPALEASLWKALARTSGVTYLGTTTDRLGRPAQAFSSTADPAGQRTILLISPDTGQLVEVEVVQATSGGNPHINGPAVTSFTTYVLASRSPRLVRPMD